MLPWLRLSLEGHPHLGAREDPVKTSKFKTKLFQHCKQTADTMI